MNKKEAKKQALLTIVSILDDFFDNEDVGTLRDLEFESDEEQKKVTDALFQIRDNLYKQWRR